MTTHKLKMAKASQADLDAAIAIADALRTISQGCDPSDENQPTADFDDGRTCIRVMAHLRELADRGSLFRVVWGMQVLLDPDNQIVDPALPHLELHSRLVNVPRVEAAADAGAPAEGSS